MNDQATAAKAMLDRMKGKHPAAFPIPIRPLKVGIREDLVAAGWMMDQVKLALGYYVNLKAYLAATYELGAFRIDLNGCPTNPFQQHEASWARAVREGRSPQLAAIMERCARGEF